MANENIQALFDADPLSLTRDDLNSIISTFRGMRHQFKLGDDQAGNPKKLATPAKPKKAPVLDIEI